MAVVACSRVFGNCLSRFPGLRGESCVLTMEMGLAGLAPCHLWLDSPPSMEAAMRCEQWHAEMIERPLIRQMKDRRTGYRPGMPEVRPHRISAADHIVLEKIGGVGGRRLHAAMASDSANSHSPHTTCARVAPLASAPIGPPAAPRVGALCGRAAPGRAR